MAEMGFFDLGTGEKPVPGKKYKISKTGCEYCGRLKGCSTPKMPISGEGKKRIFIIGDAPSKSEDRAGKLFSGSSGKMFRDVLTSLGVNLDTDCWYIPAVRCYSDKDAFEKDAFEKDAECCSENIHQLIKKYQPRVIITTGILATASAIGRKISGRISSVPYTDYFGEIIPDFDFNTYICPTYSAQYILKYDRDMALQIVWKEHIEAALKIQNCPKKRKMDIHICKSVPSAINAIKSMKNVVSFDYETTGIKPHRDGHKIYAISICCEPGVGYAFPCFDELAFRTEWRNLLTNPNIGKIAHRLGFENSWSYNISPGAFVENWEWDTCLGAHSLHNDKTCQLKFHAYTKFGDIGYDEHVDVFIRGKRHGEDPKSSNSFNRVHEADIDELLKYCAIDSINSYELYLYQKKKMSDFQKVGFKFFMEGAETLSKIHETGMRIDLERLSKNTETLSEEIENAEEIVRTFDEYYKWDGNKALNLMSPVMLSRLFYDILKYPLPVAGASKTDEDAMDAINTPFSKSVIRYRKAKKIRDTYFAQFQRELWESIIHPFFNLDLVSTYRSSSNDPNFQNIPKRDKHAQTMVRSLIRPRPGNRLIEYDYKGVEVSVGACYHKDPTMIAYILDPTTDMHRDMAIELFFRDEKTFLKEERQISKNGFVFPAFYGSGTQNIAPNIWGMLPNETKAHLAEFGIQKLGVMEKDPHTRKVTRITGFYKHVYGIEQKFWGERFSGYKDWKQKLWERYQKKGYITSYTGFTYVGQMSFTEATNYPIQGSAFHCLLWALTRTADKVISISGRSCIIGQIHDAIVVDAHPDDEKEIDWLMYTYGTQRIRKYWDWIIVPLTIEKEASEVDGDWANMKSCGKLSI